jgi:branched-chain amino acid aminotransferase
MTAPRPGSTSAGQFFWQNRWYDENPPIVGPGSHAFWMASVAFDGARSIGGLVPDLDRHCERLLRSAVVLGLEPTLSVDAITALARDGVRRFPKDRDLYIRPAFHAENGFVSPDPASTRFSLAVIEAPFTPFRPIKVGLSSFRRPARDMAPTEAKAACLYPNSARALREAAAQGEDNAVLLDANGAVAELATANIWLVKDGVAITPAETSTFLAGVTRARVSELLQRDGIRVVERTVKVADLHDADELFSTGNYGKVMPIVRFAGRDLQPGPVARRAHERYMEFARGCSVF